MIFNARSTATIGVLLVTLCAGFRVGADETLPPTTPPATHDVVDQSSQPLARPPCEYTAAFSQARSVSGIPVPLKSTGRVLFSCHHGMIWQTDEPVRETIVYTLDDTHFSINGNNDARQLNDLIHRNMASLLLPMMAGDLSALEQRFIVSRDDDAILVRPRDEGTARFLKQIRIVESGDKADIAMIDGRDQTTSISVFGIAPLDSLDLERCRADPGGSALGCEALLFPQELAATLTSDR